MCATPLLLPRHRAPSPTRSAMSACPLWLRFAHLSSLEVTPGVPHPKGWEATRCAPTRATFPPVLTFHRASSPCAEPKADPRRGGSHPARGSVRAAGALGPGWWAAARHGPRRSGRGSRPGRHLESDSEPGGAGEGSGDCRRCRRPYLAAAARARPPLGRHGAGGARRWRGGSAPPAGPGPRLAERRRRRQRRSRAPGAADPGPPGTTTARTRGRHTPGTASHDCGAHLLRESRTWAELGQILSEGGCSSQAWYRPALETESSASFRSKDCKGSSPHQTVHVTLFLCLHESTHYTSRAHTSTLLSLASQTLHNRNAIHLWNNPLLLRVTQYTETPS